MRKSKLQTKVEARIEDLEKQMNIANSDLVEIKVGYAIKKGQLKMLKELLEDDTEATE